MRIRYYKCKLDNGTYYSNFGDELNAWLWPKLLPGLFDKDPNIDFLGIGTLLGYPRPIDSKQKRIIIFGTGAVSSSSGQIDPIDDRWRIYFVRGPLTASAYSLAEGRAITDPAILTSIFFKKKSSHDFLLGFMPHISQAIRHHSVLQNACMKSNVIYIDPRDPIQNIVHKISSVSMLASEAMHGAIVADALRIPWIPVHTTYSLHIFKWTDWCQSLGVHFAPKRIFNFAYLFRRLNYKPPFFINSISSHILAWHFRRLANFRLCCLSEDVVLKRKLEQIQYQLEMFTTDCKTGVYNLGCC